MFGSSTILLGGLSLVSIGSLNLVQAAYPRIESWTSSNFFSGFNFPASTYDNTTNGDVFWATAQNTSLLYTTNHNTVIMKVDNTSTVPYNEKRYAPKLLSKTTYQPGTVWVMDALHLPYGCSVWPAFWTQGPNWPANGEIDIMEGINDQTWNEVGLHTAGSGCLASTTASITGQLTYNNCSIAANSDTGCLTNITAPNNYGPGFASAGGGVYIAEFTNQAIKVWFFTRSAVPSSVTATATSIDTTALGTPTAEYDSSACNIAQYFGPQTLTIDITLCGDFAGVPALLEETCPTLAVNQTCYTTYVIGNGSNYNNAYFEFNYVNVYSNSTTASSTSNTSSSTTGTTTAGLSSGTASSTSGKSAGFRNVASVSSAVWSVVGGVVMVALGGWSML